MSKELTEQWLNGTLEQKYYYVKYFGNGQKPFVEIELKNFLLDLVKVKDSDKIEVLAPVPTYEQYIGLIDDSKELDKAYDKINLLQKRLAIATKALNDIKVYSQRDWDEYNCMGCARKALKEMEGVK